MKQPLAQTDQHLRERGSLEQAPRPPALSRLGAMGDAIHGSLRSALRRQCWLGGWVVD